MDIITPQHSRWNEFVEALEHMICWVCGGTDKPLTTRILEEMGGFDVPGSLAFFEERGGYCDCEIILNGARVVKLRNALAHGIVVARSPQPPLRLIKFGKVEGSRDKATVEFAAEMTDHWLREQRLLIREAIETVSAHVKATEA